MRLKLGTFTVIVAALASSGIPAQSYKNPGEGHLVDSGSFAIFRQGRRIGTETFTIHERPDLSVTVAQLKIEDGNDRASQTSELQMAPNGDLRHYEWKELSPEKAQASVDYRDQFLV